MTKWIVTDGRKLAKFPEHNVHPSWNISSFPSWEAAVEYANKWLGLYGPFIPDDNSEMDYSRYGDILKIEKVE